MKQGVLRAKHFAPAAAFLGGFLWDTLTLKRIDNWLDLSILCSYLAFSGLVTILVARDVKSRFSKFFPWAIQFFFGGLFSAFVVYYFKSASSWPAFFFVLALVILLVSNEFLSSRFQRLNLTILLFGICAFMLLNFLLPVVLGKLHALVFLLATFFSFGLVYLLRLVSGKKRIALWPVLLLYGLLSIAYFSNVIPPVPLAKKHIGVYRAVSKTKDRFTCTEENQGPVSVLSPVAFHHAAGETAFCFSSIFAPVNLQTRIYHQWFYYDPTKKEYRQTDRLGYRITGGRADGYRGYTFKCNITPGRWKVAVMTEEGKVLGYRKFEVVPRDTTKPLPIRMREF